MSLASEANHHWRIGWKIFILHWRIGWKTFILPQLAYWSIYLFTVFSPVNELLVLIETRSLKLEMIVMVKLRGDAAYLKMEERQLGAQKMRMGCWLLAGRKGCWSFIPHTYSIHRHALDTMEETFFVMMHRNYYQPILVRYRYMY